MELKDTLLDSLGLGFGLWLAGYLASFVLFFALPQSMLGLVLFIIFTPVTILVAYWRFHKRQLPLAYFLKVSAAWTAIAIVFDYIFIVVLLKAANYYQSDVLLYYAVVFLVPAAIGLRYAKRG